jgi:lauroyl/myristoyl acyltransferase
VADRVLLRHRIEYGAVTAVLQLARLLPMRVVLGAGTLLGAAFYRFDRPHRHLAISNLQAAFPLRSHEDCEAIARGMFAHFGRLLTVLLKFSTMSPKQMLARVEFEGTRSCTRWRSSRWRCWHGRSTILCSIICWSRCGGGPATR